MNNLSPKAALLIAGASMCTLGIVSAAIGPSLPDLATNTSSSLATIGAVFSATFLGGLITQLFGGPLNDRIGQRPVMIGGIALMALGTCGIAASSWLPLTLASSIISGLGRGAISISAHLLIARVFATRSAAALNVLNVFYGVGAVAGPAIAGLALRAWGTALIALWLGAALLLAQIPLIMRLATVPRIPRRREAGTREARPLRSPLLWICGTLLLIYVGCETGVGGWTTTYLELTAGLETATAALITGSFWLAITGGRVIGAVIGTRLSAPTLLLGSLCGSLVGALLFASSTGNVALTTTAIVILGISLGPIYPTVLAIIASHFQRTPGTAVSVASAMGGLGGTLLPWLQGNLLERSGPTSSVLMIVAATVVMLALDMGRRVVANRSPEGDEGRRTKKEGQRTEDEG